MNYLLLFSLSPVQGFIERARKTKDLYTASAILSELSRVAMDAFKAKLQGQCIFPTISNEDTDKNQSLPNRFLGCFESAETAQQLRARIENELVQPVRDTFKDMAHKALANAGISQAPSGFEAQIAQHLQIRWVLQQYEPAKYHEAQANIEHYMASIKNWSSFEQFSYAGRLGEQGRKCSLEGDLNALFYPLPKDGKQPAYLAEQAVPLAELDNGECLSALGLLKRFYPNEADFPSVAEVAMAGSLSQLSSQAQRLWVALKAGFEGAKGFRESVAELVLAEEIQDFNLDEWREKAQSFKVFPFDPEFVYEGNINDKTLPGVSSAQLDYLQHLAARFRLKGPKLPKYYALVCFDGDSMGDWLAGKKLKAEYKQGEKLKQFHQAFSTCLGQFAQRIKPLLSTKSKADFFGHTVYSGGDDFLGFVGLESLFPWLEKLHKLFAEKVAQPLAPYIAEGQSLSFSAGIAIAHYKEPLATVLQKARAAEKSAKRQGLRNAFAITVVKGSGEILETVYSWKAVSKSGTVRNSEAIYSLVQDLQLGRFSAKFIGQIAQMFQDLAGVDMNRPIKELKDAHGQKGLEHALLAEMQRLLKRSQLSKAPIPLDQINQFLNKSAWWTKTLNVRIQRREPRRFPRKRRIVRARVDSRLFQLWHNAQALRLKALEQGQTDTPPILRYFVHSLYIADFIQRKIKGEG